MAEGKYGLCVVAGGKVVESERNADRACTWLTVDGSSSVMSSSHTDGGELCYSETPEENFC